MAHLDVTTFRIREALEGLLQSAEWQEIFISFPFLKNYKLLQITGGTFKVLDRRHLRLLG